jgi:diguanylate cyclase (GGDEF)-like protein
MMPDLSGLELCQKIRAEAKHYTYILLLTGMTEKDSVVQGLAAGANDYLTKPFHAGELLARIGVGRRMVDMHKEIDDKNVLLERMAHTDPLTGLANRRALEEWANRQLRGATRHGFPFWVVLADLDRFKEINDTYGHDAGDMVLRKFAEILSKNTRASDICGRLGGDEFLIVITHVEKQNIQAAVDRFCKELAVQECVVAGRTVRSTASFGVAGFAGTPTPDFATLLKEADKALYTAKLAGRNRVEIGSSLAGEVAEGVQVPALPGSK